jgi:3-dehydroquinate dehydratase/shikimate dehydrogenase
VPTIAINMGEEGIASRVLAGKFGAFLTFACESDELTAAPGQVSLRQMLDMYRFPQIDADTEVYGVIANPVAHSMSPAIHNAAFRAVGRNAVYLPLKVDDPARFLEGFEPLGLRGLSVTIPHKETVRELMDAVDELSAGIGAVNTVLIHDGRRSGRNTDVAAALSAIAHATERAGMEGLDGRKVLVVGAGGAGRAIAYGLVTRGAEVTIANRTVSRAEKLASELGARACGLDEMAGVSPDILVNATSIGMWPEVDETPVPKAMLRSGMVVFDSVYNPIQTRLLREAREAGCVTASGLEWFVKQAVAQFEWWTDADAPRDVMEQVVRSRLEGQ